MSPTRRNPPLGRCGANLDASLPTEVCLPLPLRTAGLANDNYRGGLVFQASVRSSRGGAPAGLPAAYAAVLHSPQSESARSSAHEHTGIEPAESPTVGCARCTG